MTDLTHTEAQQLLYGRRPATQPPLPAKDSHRDLIAIREILANFGWNDVSDHFCQWALGIVEQAVRAKVDWAHYNPFVLPPALIASLQPVRAGCWVLMKESPQHQQILSRTDNEGLNEAEQAIGELIRQLVRDVLNGRLLVELCQPRAT
jgi:hypothetical protein